MAAKLDFEGLLMPKATAMWLIENTALNFEQIADFTGLHSIEVQALADEEVGRGIVGRNPVEHGELAESELEKAKADETYRMKRSRSELPAVKARGKGPRYTPVSKRGDKPDAVAYILKHHPEISDAQICKLIGTTKPTILAVRDKSHSNMQNIKARHPVDLGLCTYSELEAASHKAFRAQGKDPAEMAAAKEKATETYQKDDSADRLAGFDFSNFVNRKSSGGEG